MAEAGARSGLVVALVGLEDPEHDEAAARSGDVLDAPARAAQPRRRCCRVLGVHDHAGGPVGRGEAVAAVHVREADRPAVVGGEHAGRHRLERLVEVAPDGFAQRWVAVDRLGVVVQPRHRHEIGRRDRLQKTRLDHRRRGYFRPAIRSADGPAARGEAARGGGRAASRRGVPRHREGAVRARSTTTRTSFSSRRSSRRSRPTRPSTRSRRRCSSATRRRRTSRTPTPTRSRSSSTRRGSSARRRRA